MRPAGICATARSATAIWSVALFAPALSRGIVKVSAQGVIELERQTCSTKEKKNLFQSACSNLYGGEPLGEPPPPGLGEDRPAVSDELVEQALEHARLRATVRDMPEPERERLVEGLLDSSGRIAASCPRGCVTGCLTGCSAS